MTKPFSNPCRPPQFKAAQIDGARLPAYMGEPYPPP